MTIDVSSQIRFVTSGSLEDICFLTLPSCHFMPLAIVFRNERHNAGNSVDAFVANVINGTVSRSAFCYPYLIGVYRSNFMINPIRSGFTSILEKCFIFVGVYFNILDIALPHLAAKRQRRTLQEDVICVTLGCHTNW